MLGNTAFTLPSFFSPALGGARLYAGVQRRGDVCFNPSGCVHCVRNVRFTVSLTHNYVDASNLADVLTDAVRDSVQD